MFKKMILFLIGTIFFSGYHLAFAGLVINEIMYDLLEGADTGREWVEIYNNSDTVADLSTFKFFEANTNHGLAIFQGNINIGAYDYAVIVSDHVKFKIDWPSFSGTIFDSSFSLSNAGEALAIKDASLNVIDQYTYSSATGAAGDGNSLQKIGGIWTGATPTPGITNEIVTSPPPPSSVPDSSGSSSGSSSSSSSTSLLSGGVSEPKIKTQITTKTLAFARLPLSFQASAFGYNGERLRYGNYFWNFGDGYSLEAKVSDSQKFTHTYFYPGEYNVNLEYYLNNYYGDAPDASDKVVIKIVPADILISAVGDEKDFFVELSNNTNYDADLSNWILLSDGKNFSFPRNTVIGSKKKIIISSKITDFSIEDKSTLKLMTAQGNMAFDYSASTVPAKVVSAVVSPAPSLILPLNKGEMPKVERVYSETEIPVENLPVSAIESDVIKNSSNNLYSPMLISLISFVFIGASAGAVYFIRQKKGAIKIGDDFNILDE